MKADEIINHAKSLHDLLSNGFTLCISKSENCKNNIDIETDVFYKLTDTDLVKFECISDHIDSDREYYTDYWFWFESKNDFDKAIEISNVDLSLLGDGDYPLEILFHKNFPTDYI